MIKMTSYKDLYTQLKRSNGSSLTEFAVTVSLMAILAITAMPKLSSLGENAKKSKSMSELDKIARQAANFYQQTAVTEGRGRFPGQDKYNLQVGGHDSNQDVIDDIVDVYDYQGNLTRLADYTYFGSNHVDFPKPEGAIMRWDDEDDVGPCNVCPESETIGREEWARLFPGGPVGSPFQDGHYVYQVVAGSGHGSKAEAPIFYVADIENPSELHVIFQP